MSVDSKVHTHRLRDVQLGVCGEDSTSVFEECCVGGFSRSILRYSTECLGKEILVLASRRSPKVRLRGLRVP